jgi:hypothetical protein
LYDRIGVGYSDFRRPDPRIAARVDAALGQCASVVNVGAGTGSYEPSHRSVLAVEPSAEMIRQRARAAARVIQADAVRLPFKDGSFDEDGFLGAYWRRPAAYLDARVRAVISIFAKLDATPVLTRLATDLADGTWRSRYGELLTRRELDVGYRLIVARCT